MATTSLAPMAPRASAATPTAGPARRPAATALPPPVGHALKAGALHGDRAARAMGSATATAQLFMFGLDGQAWSELFDMGQAVSRRLRAMQTGWIRDWLEWTQYASQLKGADTMSKFVERECNIAGQFGQILGKHATDLAGLQENIEVSYNYWVSEKLRNTPLGGLPSDPTG